VLLQGQSRVRRDLHAPHGALSHRVELAEALQGGVRGPADWL